MYLKFWEKIKLSGNTSIIDKIAIFLAEFLGTAILLFLGCLGCTYKLPGVTDFTMAATCFGLAVMIAVQCFGPISGGHVNPLLTIGAVIIGYVPIIDAIFFILGQFLGAICGFGLLRILLPLKYVHLVSLSLHEEKPSETSTGICSGVLSIREENAMCMELLASFILVLVLCAIWDAKNKAKTDSTAIRIGLSVAGLALATGPYTGGHFNTARTLAPAIINNYWTSHWIYWVGQLVGAVAAGLIYSIIFSSSDSSSVPTYEEEA